MCMVRTTGRTVLLTIATLLASCGFSPRPESGTMACKAGGTNCCPDGYLCVGRGLSTPAGPSAGTCWDKRDLPLSALATTHDATPTIANDPACVVTDWWPPGTRGVGGAVDSGVIDTSRADETGGAYPEVRGGASGADAPLVQDAARDRPEDPSTLVPGGQDAQVADTPIFNGTDGVHEATAELPWKMVDAGTDAAKLDGHVSGSGGSLDSGGTSPGSGGTTTGSGGVVGSGGVSGLGGTSSGSGGTTTGSGGVVGSGGVSSSGGTSPGSGGTTTGSGGVVGSGGVSSSGGTSPGSGGATTGSGGVVGSGGASSSGGTSPGGGGTTTGSGGVVGSGGVSGSGGTSPGSGGTTTGSGGSTEVPTFFSAFCGCPPDDQPYSVGGPLAVVGAYGTVRNASGEPVAAGPPRLVQYIYVGSDGIINDPNGDGTVQAGDDLVNLATYYVGDDTDVGASYTNTAGKFFHGFVGAFVGVAAAADQFYVRVWDRDPTDPAALFGDSDLFSPAVAAAPGFPPPIPSNVGVADFTVQLAKAAPRAPGVWYANKISANPPSATLHWNATPGARYYSYQAALSSDSSYASPVASGTIYNSGRHAASVDDSTAEKAEISLGTSGGNQNYRFRVKAGNDFGESAWVEGTGFYIPEADSYSGNVGCVIPAMGLSPIGTAHGPDGVTPLPSTGGGSTAMIEYITLGTNDYIDGPSGLGQTGDDIVVSSVPVGASNLVPFSGQDGKFYHGISGVLSGGVTNNFIVRAWDKYMNDSTAKFGESINFTCMTSAIGLPVPNDVPLGDFSTIFPQSAPDAPPWVVAEGIDSSPPQATLKWYTSLGARYWGYQVALSSDPDYRSPVAAGTVYNDVRRHFAAIDDSTVKDVVFGPGSSGDDQNYIFRIRAGNSYGESDWTSSALYVPVSPDTNRQSVVTDLRAPVRSRL
jgi:hypothetical protein